MNIAPCPRIRTCARSVYFHPSVCVCVYFFICSHILFIQLPYINYGGSRLTHCRSFSLLYSIKYHQKQCIYAFYCCVNFWLVLRTVCAVRIKPTTPTRHTQPDRHTLPIAIRTFMHVCFVALLCFSFISFLIQPSIVRQSAQWKRFFFVYSVDFIRARVRSREIQHMVLKLNERACATQPLYDGGWSAYRVAEQIGQLLFYLYNSQLKLKSI